MARLVGGRLGLLLAVLAACGPGEPSPERGAAGSSEAARAAAEAEGAGPRLAGTRPPAAAGRAGFVGSARCAACHPGEAAAWRGSHHDLAMQAADEETVLGDFADAKLARFPVVTRFFRRDGRFFVETEGPDGRPAEFEVKYTFGVDPLQQYLVELPGGRLQVLPVAWDVRRRRWFAVQEGERVPPGDPLRWTGRYWSWNAMCAECHSTDLRKGYDAETDRYATTWSEIDVACEACHGPGAEHVASSEAGGPGRGAGVGLAVRFDAGHPHAEIDACAPCHARRSRAAAEDLHGHAFLDDFAPQTLREGVYYADGQLLEEVYEYGSFLQSRMYAMGVRCSDCHDPHSLALRAEGDALCTRCHSETPDPRFPSLRGRRYDAAEHHHHPPGSEGARCVGCHMPERTYMVVDPRRDHSLRIPRPDLSAKLGTPNACNVCHADRDAEWAARAVARWYGPGRRRERHFGEVLAVARERRAEAGADLVALARDAAQPAIVRATAVELLPGYGPEAEAALVEAASDPEGLVRLAAARSLDLLPFEARLEPARRGLQDPARAVRVESARALGPLASDFLGPHERRALLAALAEYEAIQLAEADLGPAHHNLALLAEARGDAETAEREYRAALRLDPGFQPARVNLATLLNRAGRNAEAEAELREALARAPEDGEVHYSLGLLLAERERLDEAEAELRRASGLLPRRARVRYNHALALERLGRIREAEAQLLAARAAQPRDPDPLRALVALYARAGSFEAALPLARELVELAPGEGSRALLRRVEEEVARRAAGREPGSG
jgi:predicted CXXCH cytochrome family protein